MTNRTLELRFILRSSLLCAAITTAACATDDDPDASGGSTGAADGSSSEGGDSTGMGSGYGSAGTTGVDLDALYACQDPGLFEARPLSGPGYDPSTGLIDPQAEYLVSSTQILPIPEQQQRFLDLVADVGVQLENQPGFVAYGLAIEPTCGFARTISVWRDETSMLAFVGSGAHATAMAATAEVGVTGRVTSFTVAAADLPISWETAIERIAEVAPF